jgi:hypothetical protein
MVALLAVALVLLGVVIRAVFGASRFGEGGVAPSRDEVGVAS